MAPDNSLDWESLNGDMCAFFKEIEKNPKRLVTGLTVRDYVELSDHLEVCDECYEVVQRVDASNPHRSLPFSIN